MNVQKLSAVAAALLCVMGPLCMAQPTKPRQFIFDGGFSGTAGLAFQFSRPLATIDFAGQPVAPDQPRPTRPSTLAGAPVVTQVRAANVGVPILGSGFDHDGVTPLLVVCQFSPGRLDVFNVAGDALLAAEATGIGRIRTTLGTGGDIMRGAYPGKRYIPTAGSVACGLIVLLCDVTTLGQNGLWVETGVAFVASQDQGHTWSLLYDDGPVQEGHKRAREWSMTNWWPMSFGPDPLEAWFAATDYRSNPGSSGGRAFLFRATRPSISDAWVVEPVDRFYEQLADGEHFHTAAALPYGDAGMRAIVSIGDGQAINRVVSLARHDRDYLSPDGWTIDEAYHGSAGTPGTMGNQFCGCAPFAGGALLGADLGDEQLMRMDLSPLSPHPTTSWVYGHGSANKATDCSNFVIRTPTPNLPGTPYVSWFQIGGRVLPGSQFARRVLFSPDGEHWTQAINPEASTPPTIALHGSDIYFDRRDTPAGLFRSPMPALLTRRPLEIGPGGLQRLAGEPVVIPAKGGTITPLPRSLGGLWLDGGIPINPQPPSLGQVYHVKASRFASTKSLGIIRPAGNALNVGDIVGVDAVATRFWARNLDPAKSARPRLSLRSSDNTALNAEDLHISITDRWMPITPTYSEPIGPGKYLELVVASGGATPDDEDFYLAMDAAIEGYGFAGYPLPPDTTNPPVGTACPDEAATVLGLACGRAWTVTLAGQLPPDGFDGTVTLVNRWPLAAVWADQNNYVQLIADTVRRRLIAEIYSGGALAGSIESTEIYWLRGSAVLVSLADAGEGTGIHASFSVGSLPVREANPTPGMTTASLATPPIQVRFGDASGASGDGHAVRQAPMLWWGGQVDTDRARSQSERAAMLTSLSFLTLPGKAPCRADLDADGQLTILDYLAFHGLFAAGDGRADLDQSTGVGVLDVLDFEAFEHVYQAGCN